MSKWLFSGLLAGWAALTNKHLRGRWVYLASLKVVGTAVSPFFFIVNAMIALWGARRRDGVTAVFGLVGAFFSGRYVMQAAAAHDGLAQALGSDWEASLPQQQRAHFLVDRYTFPLPPPPDAPWKRDVIIGCAGHTADPLLADVWQPSAETPRSGLALIYLHGSGWHYLDKDFGTRFFFRHLAQRGHVVIDLAYTMPPKTDLPGMVADVKRAIAWAKAQADAYGFRAEGVVLMGGSAGGHLALLAGFTPNHPAWQPQDVTLDTAVAGVISYYGITDLRQMHEDLQLYPIRLGDQPSLETWMKQKRVLPPYGRFLDAQHMITSLLGGTPEQCPDAYDAGSPLTYIGAHCPPTLLVNGAHDFAVSVAHHGQVFAALQEAGVTAVHHELPYTDHAFDLLLPRWAPAYQTALYDLERFLAWLSLKMEY